MLLVLAWLQPAELLRDGAPRPGGRIGAGVTWNPAEALGLRLGAEAKSRGFVIGETWLDPTVRGTLQAVVRLP